MDQAAILKDLSALFPGGDLKSDKESLVTYGRDWTRYEEPDPTAVVFPRTTEQIQKLVRWARKTRTALVPSGGRTGLSGAALAARREVVVSFEKINHILGLNEEDLTITVEPGVVTESLQKFAWEKGYYFPVDFASKGSSHIGGNIATNAGGVKVLRYGLMRNWVAGLQVVTGRGDIMDLNRSLVKNATGYDLRHLFIGSEGTLGFVTRADIRICPQPAELKVFVLGVPNLDSVMKVFTRFRRETSLMAFELFTDKALKYVLAANPHLSMPFASPSPVYLLAEVEAPAEDNLASALEIFENCVEKGLVIDGVLAQSEAQAKNFWALRENVAESVARYTPYKNDISVTISKVPEFMRETEDIFRREYPDLEVIWFGHIGDGNLHISILRPKELPMLEFVERCHHVDEVLFSSIEKFGGSVSAEHGVGLTKKPFLHHTRSESEIQLMREIKRIFDPDLIMNPGKIFDI